MSLYGRRGVSGVHIDEVDPVPNLYDPHRKTHFQDHKQFYLEDEQKKHEIEDFQLNQQTLNLKLKSP